MRKFNFLIGAVGGAFGGYVLTNKKLRKKLANAKDANEAARILGKEIQKNGKSVAKEMKEWIESDEVQNKMDHIGKYMTKQGKTLKRRAQKEFPVVAKKAKAKAKTVVKRAKKAVRKKTRK